MKKTIFLAIGCFSAFSSFSQVNKIESFRLVLRNNWKMQSSITDTSNGHRISQSNFPATGWYNVSVPTTVIGGLLANNVYDFDPFFSNNLEKLADKKMDNEWWFRKTFVLPVSEKGKIVILKLHGINYKGNVWLNGKLIADSNDIKGPFVIHQLDITHLVRYTGNNVLAIEIIRPFNPNHRGGDLAIDYADWIHYPPDYNGGIVNDVEINTYHNVAVMHPLVTTQFDLPSLTVAHLSVDADVINYSGKEQDAIVKGIINNTINFEQKVHLAPNERKQVTFTSSEYPQLNIRNPAIWWPWQYGDQPLHRIKLVLVNQNIVSNTIEENFGIRQITSRLIDNTSRVFIVNGRQILLRGAAWSPDIFQRRSEERQEQEMKLVRDMRMNIIRSEGKLEDDHFYDLCDKYGMLVMNGWMCCGAWQYPENWEPDERRVAMRSDSSVMYWLRNRACMLAWLNGSDMPPRDSTVEQDFLTIESNLKWPNPILSTADASVSKVSGYSGVKMNGPYDWVPPIYWETDSARHGGAWSFATEISPGPSIPPYESLVKFIPQDSIWYDKNDWLYHCGTMQFSSSHIFDSALNERYGSSSSIKEFVSKAQAQNYEAHRAMMEAYGLNKYNTATGVVQWMLSNPWPSLIWHTYDYYLYPAGTYFGIKKSLEPLHVMYSYKSDDIYVVNSFIKKFDNLKVKADLYDMDGSIKYSRSTTTSVQEDSTQKCFTLPAVEGLTGTYFLRLQLDDAMDKTQSINWYWLSQKKDSLQWSATKWFYTPQSAFADFTGLKKLAPTTIKTSYTTSKTATRTTHRITVTNTGKVVLFFLHIRVLKDKNGDDILPVIFEDNYLLLAPGESRTINCSYENKYAGKGQPYIVTTAWNAAEAMIKVTPGK